jgi:Icc-related predicted phosphoesterase
MKITFISDTHSKHNIITNQLPGGDLIIHAGDFSSIGYGHELKNFLNWFTKLDYTYKIFISGNHDWCFQDNPYVSKNMVNQYDIIYLEDNFVYIEDVKIYGLPWQPEFMNWAFNLPRNGVELQQKVNNIPNNTEILISHGPPFGHLDQVNGEIENLGCKLLRNKVDEISPKINIFGHIHTGYGYKYNNGTHFINASILDERYVYRNKILNVNWDNKINLIEFID